MFSSFDIDYDKVTFKYTSGGAKETIFVDIPDGVSVSQWTGVWGSFREILESGGDSIEDYINNALAEADKKIEELEEENENLRDEYLKLEREFDEMKGELEELEFRLESLDK